MTKKIITLVGALVAVVSISSCATVKGIGQDVQSLGRNVEKSAR